jgi:hypothetical protein
MALQSLSVDFSIEIDAPVNCLQADPDAYTALLSKPAAVEFGDPAARMTLRI